jgi:hypothetical protein
MRWSVALILPMIFAGWARAQTSPQVNEFLTQLNTHLAVMVHQSAGEVSIGCARLTTSSVNIDAIAHGAGADIWSRMTPQQRGAYRAVIERRAVRECVHQNRDHTGAPLTLVGMRQGQSGDWLLATRSSHAGGSHNVIWRLRDDGQRLRAVDILFDGRSTILIFRDETKNLLDRYNGIIDMMIEAFDR